MKAQVQIVEVPVVPHEADQWLPVKLTFSEEDSTITFIVMNSPFNRKCSVHRTEKFLGSFSETHEKCCCRGSFGLRHGIYRTERRNKKRCQRFSYNSMMMDLQLQRKGSNRGLHKICLVTFIRVAQYHMLHNFSKNSSSQLQLTVESSWSQQSKHQTTSSRTELNFRWK